MRAISPPHRVVPSRLTSQRCRFIPPSPRLPASQEYVQQHYAASGGEDYELLVAMPPEFGEPEAQALAAKCGVPFSRIGAVSAGQGATFWSEGAVVELTGFSHFDDYGRRQDGRQ